MFMSATILAGKMNECKALVVMWLLLFNLLNVFSYDSWDRILVTADAGA